MNCPNCKAPLTCSCKIRKATDGTQVCTNCQALYEQFLINNSKAKKP